MERQIKAERLDSRRRSCLKRLENGARRKERDYRAMVRYASGDRHGLKPFTHHPPLGEILADGACRSIVTTFMPVGCSNMPSAAVLYARCEGKALRTAIGRNWPFVQSQEFVEPFAKKRRPAHQKGEQPR